MKLKLIIAALFTIFGFNTLYASSDTIRVDKYHQKQLRSQRFYLSERLVKEVKYKYRRKENSIITINNPNEKPERKNMKVYRKNGLLLHDVNFIGSRPEGIVKSYFENGQICCLQFYKHGKLDSMATTFHDNGQVGETAIYKQGKLMQVLEKYDRMGHRLEKGNLTNGFGIVNDYDVTGRLIGIEHYQNGKRKSYMKR